MPRWGRLNFYAMAALLAAFVAVASPARSDQPQRVTITGEVIDSWCYLSEIMWATGNAHHQCAIWCARGGVLVRSSANSIGCRSGRVKL